MTLVTALPPSLDDLDDNAPGHANGSGGRLVSTDGRVLPLEHTHLACDTRGGLARAVLEQRFRNPHDAPLEVTYLLPLPADGAVSGFRFRIGETVINGEVDRREQARERFEQALLEGKTAALLDQERADVFTQRVGNIPPGEEIACEVVIDQRLRWLPEGVWEWRFPTVVGPRYQGAPGRVRDADRLDVAVADRALAPRMTLALAIRDALAPGVAPDSPSHPLRTVHRAGAHEVCFAADRRVRLDRDVVVRWPAATREVGLSLDAARPSADAHEGRAYGLLTVVPPAPTSSPEPLPRDLIFLIDTSGSMGGRPLDQAGRVVCAMIDTLGERDRIELVEFSSRPRRWRPEPVVATRDGKREAQKWVRKLRAGGATEMHDAVLEALRPLRDDCQRQVVLITDGYIGFEREIIAAITAHLPRNCRLHTLGVGSAPNRSLTGPAARAGAGVELIVGLDEDVERAAQRLLARTTAPLVTDLEIDGSAVRGVTSCRLPDLFAGAPTLIGLELAPDGGEIRVRGSTASGPFEQVIESRTLALGEGNQAVTALCGREQVEDAEMRIAGTGARHGEAAVRDAQALDAEIERLGLTFQIATRLTSWIAVTDEATVDPGGRRIRETMPHEQPYGTQIAGFGLRATGPGQANVMLGVAGFAAPAPAGIRPRLGMASTPAPAQFKTVLVDSDADKLGRQEMHALPYVRPSASTRPTVIWLVLLVIVLAIAAWFGLSRWLGGDAPAPRNEPGTSSPAAAPSAPETPNTPDAPDAPSESGTPGTR